MPERTAARLQDLSSKKNSCGIGNGTFHTDYDRLSKRGIEGPGAETVGRLPDLRGKRESAGSGNTVMWNCARRRSSASRIRAINQARLETIRNRIDQFGVAEPFDSTAGAETSRRAAARIKDAKLAKDLIKQTALPQFKLLDDENQLAGICWVDAEGERARRGVLEAG